MTGDSGKRFERKFRESAEAQGCAVIRIPDKVLMRGGRLVGEQTEADFVVVAGSETFLVECKATALQSLPFWKVKEHQERSLLEFGRAGSHAHGVLAVEFYDGAARYGTGNACYLMPIAAWLRFKDSTDRKSAPRSLFDWEGAAVRCPYEHGLYRLDFGRWSR